MFRDAGDFPNRAVVKVVEVKQHLVVGLQHVDGLFHECHAISAGVIQQDVGLIIRDGVKPG